MAGWSRAGATEERTRGGTRERGWGRAGTKRKKEEGEGGRKWRARSLPAPSPLPYPHPLYTAQSSVQRALERVGETSLSRRRVLSWLETIVHADRLVKPSWMAGKEAVSFGGRFRCPLSLSPLPMSGMLDTTVGLIGSICIRCALLNGRCVKRIEFRSIQVVPSSYIP